MFALVALGNVGLQPNGLHLTVAKGQIEDVGNFDYVGWNSYSRIVAEKTSHNYPMMWGGSSKASYDKIDQRYMNIDGDAGTAMYRFSGQIDDVAFLKNDITNLAYDSRKVEPGGLFIAVPGTHTDGRRYVADAARRGAVAARSAWIRVQRPGVSQSWWSCGATREISVHK